MFVIWLGLDELAKDFEHYDEKKPQRFLNQSDSMTESKMRDSQDKLDELFNDLFGMENTLKSQENEPEDEESFIYNANNDINNLVKNSAKKAIHHLVFFMSVQSIKRAKCISRIYSDEFKHKIAFRMGKDDAMEYLGRSNLILTPDGEYIDEETAVYYDGMTSRRFSPFVSDKVE